LEGRQTIDLGCHGREQAGKLLPTWTPPLDRLVQRLSWQLPENLLNMPIWSNHTFSNSGLRKLGFYVQVLLPFIINHKHNTLFGDDLEGRLLYRRLLITTIVRFYVILLNDTFSFDERDSRPYPTF